MNKKSIVPVLSAVIVLLVAALIGVCVYFNAKLKSSDANNNVKEETVTEDTKESEEEVKEDVKEDNTNKGELKEEEVSVTYSESGAMRPSLLKNSFKISSEINANTAEYEVKADLSNVYNKDLYYFNDEQIKMLSDNYFFVDKSYGSYEFFEVYENNRYYYESNFVTVDSLMHTYHLFFSHLLKNLEKTKLSEAVSKMSTKMYEKSLEQLKDAKGTNFQEAAERNVAFFAVANLLMENEIEADDKILEIANKEVAKINAASGIEKCELTGSDEDYSQYKPRGYYDNDELLRKYFKVMMWYGRIQFNSKDNEMIKSAALMNIALNEAGLNEWKDVYDITSFFVGTSDDLCFYEYYPLLQEVYGTGVTTKDIIGNTEKYNSLVVKVKELSVPSINSIPIKMGEDNEIQGFRFMGQRFTIDAMIMQKLIYSAVEKKSDGTLRMLPDVLDVTASFGSEISYDLLKEQGDFEYERYKDNLDQLINELSTDEAKENLETSLYGNWISTLKPLLSKKGKGYPMFMQNDAWAKKDIECFAGSYTELKHDTVLYAKQVMAEMGGGDIPEYDDRGYVQPEPLVYERFKFLADETRGGLKDRGLLSSQDEENLKRLSELSKSLYDISIKELNDEVLSDEEYDFIREYGGTLEHFWYDVMSYDTGDEEINTEKYQASLVVDVATDPNGQVLEMGTGRPCTIYVIVNVDGKVKIAKGSVYSFYQFAWPLEDRLTDTSFRVLMGYEPGNDGYFTSEDERRPDMPWWTKEYSYVYEDEY